MQHALQTRILDELLTHIDAGSNADAGQQMRVPVAIYTDPELAAKEYRAFFREHPQLVGLSGDLPEPGSYLCTRDFGVPLLATRDADGRFRAFLNACRHRGAALVEQRRGRARRFVCPFHGWTYGGDGRLAGVTEVEQFGDVDRACNGLVELPAEERYGLLWVHPRPDGELDVDALLGGLAPEFADWNAGNRVFAAEREFDMAMNWKLANDTFGETYHFSRLHRDTLGQLFIGDVLAYETFERNHRAVFPARTIEKLRSRPRDDWRIDAVTTVLYYLFPNIQITMSERQITLFRIYPDADNPGRSHTRVSHYFSAEALAQIDSGEKTVIDERTVYDRSARDGNAIVSPEAAMEILDSTVEHEDFRMAEHTQRAAESGLMSHFTFGRNEAPLQHFHRGYREALGLPPFECR